MLKRTIAAGLILATLALSSPAPTHAGGFLRRVFGGRRQSVQRNFSVQVGGGRGIGFSRQVVRGAAPVVVQPGFQVQQRVVQQQVFAAQPQYVAPAQVQQFQQFQQFRAGGY